MAAPDVKLLGLWASPFVLRVKFALMLKEVAYEYLEETNMPDNKSELLLKSNPIYKKVPVLLHDGKPICESMIIVQYVDEVWKTSRPSILPSDPYERAMARFWAFYIDDKWFPNYFSILSGKTEEAKAEAAEQAISGLKLIEEYYTKSYAEKPFFGGETMGYLDIALGSLLGWIKIAEQIEKVKLLDEEKTPNLVKWAQRFSTDESIKEVMPEHDKLVDLCKMLQEKVWKSKSSN